MNRWLTSYGRLDAGKTGIRIVVSVDLINFYKSLIDKEVKLFTWSPAHGAHITIWMRGFHQDISAQRVLFVKNFFKDKKIKFEYNPDIREGGGLNKGFRNWWMSIRCQDFDYIKQYLGIVDNSEPHITICNTKPGEIPYIWHMPKTYNRHLWIS
jgi:hypothetical protein